MSGEGAVRSMDDGIRAAAQAVTVERTVALVRAYVEQPGMTEGASQARLSDIFRRFAQILIGTGEHWLTKTPPMREILDPIAKLVGKRGGFEARYLISIVQLRLAVDVRAVCQKRYYDQPQKQVVAVSEPVEKPVEVASS